MEIKYMNQKDKIILQDARIKNQSYYVSWLASVYYQNMMICLKSSWLPYDEFIEEIKLHGEEQSYQNGGKLYFQKVTHKTFVEVPVHFIQAPIDVILLPITDDTIYIPKDEEMCKNIQKKIKGSIWYTKKKIQSWFSIDVMEEITFRNDSLPIPGDEIIAEYVIENCSYPVTLEMFGKTLQIKHMKKDCNVRISKTLNDKYDLRVSEE